VIVGRLVDSSQTNESFSRVNPSVADSSVRGSSRTRNEARYEGNSYR
jgi:hypothetical protein